MADSAPPPEAHEALAALQAIEQSAQFVASDVAQVLGGLQAGLQSLANNSLDHMAVYRDAAEHTRQSVSATVADGRKFIDMCASLDEQMQGVEAIAAQLGDVDRALTSLEAAFQNRMSPLQTQSSSPRRPL